MKEQDTQPNVKDLVKFFTKVCTPKVDAKQEGPCERSPVSSLTSCFEFNIRASTPLFHGREEKIIDLHKAIQSNKDSGQNLIVVSQGADVNPLGGVGKTEIVRKYIQEYKADYSHLIWIDAQNSTTLRADFYQLALKMRCIQPDDRLPTPDLDLASCVYSCLQHSKCLIVVDNVESLEITEFLPPEDLEGKPLILLITSKDIKWSQAPIIIEGLTTEEGAEFLQEQLSLDSSDEALAKVFTELCDGLPLALQIAVPLIDIIPEGEDVNSNFLQTFVESFAVEQERYLTQRLPDSLTNITTAVLMQMAEKEILGEEFGELAIDVSEKLAYLPSATVSEVIASVTPAIETSALNSALQLLKKYAIVAKFNDHYEIHPHIQTIIQEKIQTRDASSNTRKEAALLEQLTSSIHETLQSPASGNQLTVECVKAGLSVLNRTKSKYSDPKFLSFAELLANKLAKFDFIESHRMFQEILDFRIELLSPSSVHAKESTLPSSRTPPEGFPEAHIYGDQNNAPKSLASTSNAIFEDTSPCNNIRPEIVQHCKQFLKEISESEEESFPKKMVAKQILGHILSIQGEYEKALEIFYEASKVQREFWGIQSLEYLTTQNTIGSLLVDLSEYEEAFEVYSAVYEVFKDNFGPEHPFTVTVENNIAVVLHRLEKYNDAYESYENVLKKQQKLQEKDDPAVLRTKNNMAVVLELQGFHNEALEIFLEVLQLQLSSLGTFHADTLASGHNIGSILDLQGYSEEALEIYKDVYDGRKTLLGEEHVDTLSTHHNMALLLDKTKSYPEAIAIYKQVHPLRARNLGEDHKDTLNTLYNMAVALENNGNNEEAFQTYSKVQAIFQSKLGPDHPATIYCLQNMALVLETVDKFEEALEIYRSIYENQRRIFGSLHQDTLNTRYDMASVLGCLGSWKDALDMYSDVYESRKVVLGEDHPDTLATLSKMASALESLENYKGASEIYSQVLEKQMQVLGREHLDVITTKHNKTSIEFHQKSYAEALENYKKVYEIRKKALGPVHPETLSTQHNIGLVLTALEKFEEAFAIFEEVYDNRKDILGPANLDTLRTRQNLAEVLKKQKRYSESLEILTEVYSIRKSVLGNQHPETVSTKNKIKVIYKATKRVQS